MTKLTLEPFNPLTPESTSQQQANTAISNNLDLLNSYKANLSDVTGSINAALNCLRLSGINKLAVPATIPIYTCVSLDFAYGYDLASGAVAIKPMTDISLIPIGMTIEDVLTDQPTRLIQFETAQITGFDTTSSTIGAAVYINTTTGGLSLTGNKSFSIGIVEALDSDGVVKFDFGYLLNKLYEQNKTLVFADSPYTCTGRERILITDTTGGPISIILPTAADLGDKNTLLIKDDGGAATNNVTFTGTVETGTPAAFTTNYGKLHILASGAQLLEIT